MTLPSKGAELLTFWDESLVYSGGSGTANKNVSPGLMDPGLMEEWGDYLITKPKDLSSLIFCQRSLSLLCRVFGHKKKFKKKNAIITGLAACMVDLVIGSCGGGKGGINSANTSLPSLPQTSSLAYDLFNAFTRLYYPEVNALASNAASTCILIKEQVRLWEAFQSVWEPQEASQNSAVFLDAVLATGNSGLLSRETYKNSNNWTTMQKFFVKTSFQIAKRLVGVDPTLTYPRLFPDYVALLSEYLTLTYPDTSSLCEEILSQLDNLPSSYLLDFVSDRLSGDGVSPKNALGMIRMCLFYIEKSRGEELFALVKVALRLSKFCNASIALGDFKDIHRMLARRLLKNCYEGQPIETQNFLLSMDTAAGDNKFNRMLATEVFATFAVSLKGQTRDFLGVALRVALKSSTHPSSRAWILSSVLRCGLSSVPLEDDDLYSKIGEVVTGQGPIDARLTFAPLFGHFWGARFQDENPPNDSGLDFVNKIQSYSGKLIRSESELMEALVRLEFLSSLGAVMGPRFHRIVFKHTKAILKNTLTIEFPHPAIMVKARVFEVSLEILSVVSGEFFETGHNFVEFILALSSYFNEAVGSSTKKRKKEAKVKNDASLLLGSRNGEGRTRIFLQTLTFIDRVEGIANSLKWGTSSEGRSRVHTRATLDSEVRAVLGVILKLLRPNNNEDRFVIVKCLRSTMKFEFCKELVSSLKNYSPLTGVAADAYLKYVSDPSQGVDIGGWKDNEEQWNGVVERTIRNRASARSGHNVVVARGAGVYDVDGCLVVIPRGKEETKLAKNSDKKGLKKGNVEFGGDLCLV